MTSTKTPGGLLDQHKLLLTVIHAPWSTALDHKIAAHIIQLYYRQHGNSRVSLRFLEQATSDRRDRIVASLRRLIDNGAIAIIRKGEGKRPTEYALNFDLKVPINGTSNNNGDDFVEVPINGTSEVPKSGTATDARGLTNWDQTLSLSGLLPERERVIRADAREPWPARGQEAALGQQEASQAFEALMGIYKRPHGDNVPEAQKAFLAVLAHGHDPDAILSAASAWVAGVDAPRFLPKLERWLTDGLWLNEPPGRKAKAHGKVNGHSHRRGGKVDVVRAALIAGGYTENADGTFTLVEGDR